MGKKKRYEGKTESGTRLPAEDISRTENQVFSNRVQRAEFDKHWKTSISDSGYVVYTARRNDASLTVLLANGESRLITFPKGGTVLVGSGGVSHYSKPHTVQNV